MLEILNENGCHRYCPEMGDKTPTGCIFEASLSHDGKHWFLYPLNGCNIELKGRGIKKMDDDYMVTCNAFDKLSQIYPMREKEYLD